MILAAHQPNFFPWLGYFNKIHRADVFVILDDVQMIKTGSSWVNRVNLVINKEARFYSIPVVRPSGTIMIKDAVISDSKWKKRLISTLEMSYGRHPYYKANIDLIKGLIDGGTDNLCEFNLSVIRQLVSVLGLGYNKLRLASEMDIKSTATQRLIDLTKLNCCESYLEGGGASGYQEDDLFKAQGVSLIKQNFIHPTYPQKDSAQFIMGLSILDPLFNCGIDETKKLIIAGVS